MVTRLMIQIDEEKCTGCGLCVPGCAEGALAIIDGKAKVVSESFCDGLGACLGECPEGALTLQEAKTVPFDEAAAMAHVAESRGAPKKEPSEVSGGCPGSQAMVFEETAAETHSDGIVPDAPRESQLRQWPVKLKLLSPQHPILKDSNLLILADCIGPSYSGLHEDFIKGKVVVMVCPKFEDYEANLEKLTMMLANNSIKEISVIHMEVPCCGGLARVTQQALESSGKDIPLRNYVIGVQGDIKAVY